MDDDSSSTLRPFDSQVGGHKGVLASPKGSLIYKPCLPLEAEFYDASSSTEAFSHLLPFVPKFYGTLKLTGKLDENGNITATPEEGKEVLVLQNLTHAFTKPNVLDIKLGTVLYDEAASAEKRARMEKTARDTTSLETGVRLTGFSVYDYTEDKFINTPKSYGKSIKKDELPEGIARFFPLAKLDRPSGQGLTKELLRYVLQGILEEVQAIRDAVSRTEMRMVGGSILIIYEADWDVLKEAIILWKREEEEEETEFEDDEPEDSDDSIDTKPGPAYLVKLIDFAHTRLKPGEGPDAGVILGLDTIINLLTDRLKTILGDE